MPERALAVRHLAVDRVAHQRVDEAERRLRAQDLGPRQRAGGRRHRGLVDLRERGDRREARALAEHGHGARDGQRVGGLAR